MPPPAPADDAAGSPPERGAVEWLAPSRTGVRGPYRVRRVIMCRLGYRRENPAGPDSSPSDGRADPLFKYRQAHPARQGDERAKLRHGRGLTPSGAVLYFKARRLARRAAPPSSSGLGHLVLSQKTGVRFPVGVLYGVGSRKREPEAGRNRKRSLDPQGTSYRSRIAQLPAATSQGIPEYRCFDLMDPQVGRTELA